MFLFSTHLTNQGINFVCLPPIINRCNILFSEPPQILPISFPTPPPGETTVSTGQPSNTTVETGTAVTIYCPSSGIDTPVIQWFRDGVMVMPGGRLSIFSPRLRGAIVTSALRIDDFQPDTDSGTYTCRSTNIVGLANMGTTLMGG